MPKFFALVAALVCCALVGIAPVANAATYVFGEDLLKQNLIDDGPGSTWASTNTYIIAGDVYVDDDDTLTIDAGVTVYFDYDYDGDAMYYPEIEVKGTIIANGTSGSPVKFTNYSGTNKGEFEGIYLVGDSLGSIDYEGVFEGTYVEFYYGGYTNGLIRVGDDAILNLENSIVRYSDTNGIDFEGDGGYAKFDGCSIDNCDMNGIAWSGGTTDAVDSLRVENCSINDNDADGMQSPPARLLEVHVGNNYFNNGDAGLELTPPQNDDFGDWILSCHFYNNARGLIIIDADAGVGDYNILNCAFYHNRVNPGGGIIIEDMQEIANIEISHCNFVNNQFGGGGSGISIGNWNEGNNWPWWWTVELNIFLGNDAGIRLDNGNPQVPVLNAFQDNTNHGVNCGVANCLVGPGAGVKIKLVNVGRLGNPPAVADYDFHIRYSGAVNSLMDVNDDDLDPDDSDQDYGIYGGQHGNLRADIGLGEEQAYYIDLGPGNIAANLTLPAVLYHGFEDFTVPANQTYTVEAGAEFKFSDDAQDQITVLVEGILWANGDVVNPISFDRIDEDDDWFGIWFLEPTGNCLLDYVTVSNSAHEGIRCQGEAADPTPPSIDITSSTIENAALEGLVVLRDIRVTFGQQDAGNTIRGCGNSGMLFFQNDDWSDVVHNEITDNGNTWEEGGVVVDDCSPTFVRNDIHTNWDNGFILIDDGDAVIDGRPIGANDRNSNDICYNGPAGEQEAYDGAEIVIMDDCTPLIEDNNIYDARVDGNDDVREGYIIVWENGPQADDGRITDNYFGDEHVDPEDDFVIGDVGWELAGPVLIAYVSPFEVVPQADDDHPFVPADADPFDVALGLKAEQSYDEAIAAFWDIIDDDRDAVVARKALKQVFYCTELDGGDLQQLHDDLLDTADVHVDANSFFALDAKRLAYRSLATAGEIEDAIVKARDLVDEAPNRVDSIYVLIDKAMMEEQLAESYDVKRQYHRMANALGHHVRDAARRDAEVAMFGGIVFPDQFQLHPAFPNPFNSAANLTYELNDRLPITLAVYDIDGRRVTVLHQGVQSAGRHRLTWNAGSVPSGSYFIRLDTPVKSLTSRVTLVR